MKTQGGGRSAKPCLPITGSSEYRVMKTKGETPTSRLNREWHLEHRMPPKATAVQRLDWHLEHASVCACRPLTEEYLQKLQQAVRREEEKAKA